MARIIFHGWICCACGGPVDVELHGYNCPVCGHLRDENCSSVNTRSERGVETDAAPQMSGTLAFKDNSEVSEQPQEESMTSKLGTNLSTGQEGETGCSRLSQDFAGNGIDGHKVESRRSGTISETWVLEDNTDASKGDAGEDGEDGKLPDTLPRGSVYQSDASAQIPLSRSSSVESLAISLFSAFTGSSMSSIDGPEGASERLTAVLFTDPILQPLFYQAIQTTPRDRFERNLRRLLGLFSKDLYEEAQGIKERQVARFVRLQARKTAYLICNEVDPGGKSSSGLDTREIEEISDSDLEGDEMADLQYYESYICASSALENLKTNLQQFMGHAKTSLLETTKPTSLDLLSALPFSESGPDSSARTSVMTRHVWSAISRDCATVKNRFLRNPPLKKGFRRVTWKCSCGIELCDDYEELEKRAVKRLQRRLRGQKCRPATHLHTAGHSIERTRQFCISTVGSFIAHFQSATEKMSRKPTELPIVELQSTQNMQPRSPPAATGQQPPTNQLFLPLCLKERTWTSPIKVHQLAVQDVNSDRDLFQIFRAYYRSLHSRWWSWINLWEIQRIYFVHFELYEKHLVDVKELNSVPPEELDTFYRYERSKLKPPIGSNLLVHYFHCSADVSLGTPCFRKIPKASQKLTPCPIQGVCPGWGLHFVEGWSWKKILTLLCFLFVLASVLVAVLYWRFHHSIQDAFSIGTFVLACFAIGVSTLQAWSSLA